MAVTLRVCQYGGSRSKSNVRIQIYQQCFPSKRISDRTSTSQSTLTQQRHNPFSQGTNDMIREQQYNKFTPPDSDTSSYTVQLSFYQVPKSQPPLTVDGQSSNELRSNMVSPLRPISLFSSKGGMIMLPSERVQRRPRRIRHDAPVYRCGASTQRVSTARCL